MMARRLEQVPYTTPTGIFHGHHYGVKTKGAHMIPNTVMTATGRCVLFFLRFISNYLFFSFSLWLYLVLMCLWEDLKLSYTIVYILPSKL